MSAHDHRPWSDELAAYALGALEPHEAAAVEGHLVDCARCRAELARLAPAVERLPASVAPADPPRELRRRIMDAVEADAAGAPETSPPRRPPALRRRERPAWRSRPALGLALAATLALGFLGGAALRGGDGAPQRTTVRAQALTPAPVRAALVGGDGSWRLEVARLPPLPAGRVYEAWIRSARGLAPSTLFVLSRDGRARVPLPDGLRAGEEVLVTREPAGGSATPSSPPLLRVRA